MQKLKEDIKKHFPNLDFIIKKCVTKEDISQWEYFVKYKNIEWTYCSFYSWDKLSKLDIVHIYNWTHELRTCKTCSIVMSQWYIYNDEVYCSWECLPISVKQFEEEYEEDWDNCWTEWESIYLD